MLADIPAPVRSHFSEPDIAAPDLDKKIVWTGSAAYWSAMPMLQGLVGGGGGGDKMPEQ